METGRRAHAAGPAHALCSVSAGPHHITDGKLKHFRGEFPGSESNRSL